MLKLNKNLFQFWQFSDLIDNFSHMYSEIFLYEINKWLNNSIKTIAFYRKFIKASYEKVNKKKEHKMII